MFLPVFISTKIKPIYQLHSQERREDNFRFRNFSYCPSILDIRNLTLQRKMAIKPTTMHEEDEGPEIQTQGISDFLLTVGLLIVLVTWKLFIFILTFAVKTGYPVSMIVMGVLYYNSGEHCPAATGGFSLYLIIEGIALLCDGNFATVLALACNAWNTFVALWIYPRVTYDYYHTDPDFCDRTLYLYTFWASMFWWFMIAFTMFIVSVLKINLDEEEKKEEEEEETGSGGATFVLIFLSGCRGQNRGQGQAQGSAKSQRKRNKRNKNKGIAFQPWMDQ